MKTQFYLVINQKGSVRATKSKPDLKWDEVNIALSLELPDRVFQRPSMEAKIQLTEKDLPVQTIELDVQDNLRKALEQATGVQVKLVLMPPEEQSSKKR